VRSLVWLAWHTVGRKLHEVNLPLAIHRKRGRRRGKAQIVFELDDGFRPIVIDGQGDPGWSSLADLNRIGRMQTGRINYRHIGGLAFGEEGALADLAGA